MAINKNHEFEDLDGIKCAIVERNVPAGRVNFLKELLEYNHYTVVVVPTPIKVVPQPAAKPAAAEPAVPAPQPAISTEPAPPATFTIGVTDTTFNSINAIFGRLLKTSGGHVVTQAYWEQKENTSHDEIPYYENTPLKN